jgi:hypothetical protein
VQIVQWKSTGAIGFRREIQMGSNSKVFRDGAISIGVSGMSFLIGILVKKFIGIDL